ncbi:hypothetical protein [Haloechinothrix salitolerans]|uniref:Uncharacterized protein n=1 Tax=Haloechinothrix salitolerans TaxID=926830 RepID=A0ABW2BXE4_9PSEU
MIKLLTVLCAATLVFASGCSGDAPEPPATSQTPAPATSEAQADPYEVYLENAPEGAPELSREDAQTRALLGCGRDWAPGTVDAVLAEAYKDLCDQAGG